MKFGDKRFQLEDVKSDYITLNFNDIFIRINSLNFY